MKKHQDSLSIKNEDFYMSPSEAVLVGLFLQNLNTGWPNIKNSKKNAKVDIQKLNLQR